MRCSRAAFRQLPWRKAVVVLDGLETRRNHSSALEIHLDAAKAEQFHSDVISGIEPRRLH
jgi:hypothetical protein